MKTLLIPTDFDIQTLDSIPQLVQQYHSDTLNIILVHLMKITDCDQELMMLSRRSAEYRHIADEFYKACTKLKHQYAPHIASIRIEFFYGSTLAVFKNFLDANEVNAIVMLKNYSYKLLDKNSIEPALLINRCGIPVQLVDGRQHNRAMVQQAEESLFEYKIYQ